MVLYQIGKLKKKKGIRPFSCNSFLLKSMKPVRTLQFDRKSRVAKGHKTSVKYIFNLTA